MPFNIVPRVFRLSLMQLLCGNYIKLASLTVANSNTSCEILIYQPCSLFCGCQQSLHSVGDDCAAALPEERDPVQLHRLQMEHLLYLIKIEHILCLSISINSIFRYISNLLDGYSTSDGHILRNIIFPVFFIFISLKVTHNNEYLKLFFSV